MASASFCGLLDAAGVNAFVICNWNRASGKATKLSVFLKSLALSLVEKHLQEGIFINKFQGSYAIQSQQFLVVIWYQLPKS
jgi:hypothetical protein